LFGRQSIPLNDYAVFVADEGDAGAKADTVDRQHDVYLAVARLRALAGITAERLDAEC